MKRSWDISQKPDFGAKISLFWPPAEGGEFFQKFRLCHFWVFMTPNLHGKFQKKVMSSFWANKRYGRMDGRTDGRTEAISMDPFRVNPGVQKSTVMKRFWDILKNIAFDTYIELKREPGN